MNATNERTVAELVTEDYLTADVFKKFGIDFCCGGKVTVEEICVKKNISYEQLTEELNRIGQSTPATDTNFKEWTLDKLANYIMGKYHGYVTNNLELIRQYANKVALIHGGHRPETKAIARLYNEVADELAHHLQKEIILFPYVSQLAAAKRNNVKIQAPFRHSKKSHCDDAG